MEVESKLILAWLHFLNSTQKTGVADNLLAGAISSIREATACAALGLIRPALFSLRMHIDLLFAWLYFKDHPIEWKTLNETGEGFKMKRDIIEFLIFHYHGFNKRLSILREVTKRSIEDPYRLLSAHVHAQSDVVMPYGQHLADVVQSEDLALQCPKLWRDVSEYVGDILVSMYALKWTAIPLDIQSSIEARLALKRNSLERFFDGV